MRSQYDAIFKSILNDRKSQFVSSITNITINRFLPNDAGWYTGRTVDYIGESTESLYVHVEIQAAIDDTMHWRMVNYYTLLHHKLHGWEDDTISVKQFLVYIGPNGNSMKENNHHFGAPYCYKTIDLKAVDRSVVSDSRFLGDHILGLLMSGTTDQDWISVIRAVCGMQNEARKMESLFFLLQLSNLRGKTQMVENEINEMGMYEALQSTRLTARATEIASVNAVIELISDHYVDEEEPPISEEERELLGVLSFAAVKRVHKAITKQNAPRSYLMAAAVLNAGTTGPTI